MTTKLDNLEPEKNPRNLLDICDTESFHTILRENTYCSLSKTTKIGCPYISEQKDHNNLYPCLNPKHNKHEKYEKYN